LPPQPDQYERQRKANQLGIDKLEHAGLPAKQCVIIEPIFVWTGILPPGKPFVDAGFTILKKKYRKLPRNTDYSAYRHPRWWPTWLGIAAMWLVAQLPLRLQWWLGKIAGLLAWRLAKSRRHIAEVNIRLCFPELNQQQQAALVRNAFIANGIGLLELCVAWFPAWSISRRRLKMDMAYCYWEATTARWTWVAAWSHSSSKQMSCSGIITTR
jgi:hypothetical protein